MHNYAQIIGDRVHCIFEEDMTLDELYKCKYSKTDVTLIDITDKQDVREGHLYTDGVFVDPAVCVSKSEKLASINMVYKKRTEAILMTQLRLNQEGKDISPLQRAYTSKMDEWKHKILEVTNG